MLTLHLPEDNVLNGGAFGFEGSLICTVLMIVLTILIKDLKCTVDELIANKELRQKINISDYLTPTVGLPT